ncbi:hypothetical protein EHF33_06435 [Deinococcus psychrotolerans]|uniref:Uncharacterized protein n=1 Tax=Deinococcus psychrotolerans TaxID=2489213 RepID=A0A3G8YAP8_9DEIO|nr:hypothetical protein [Deinococcus psychrotolerans]AZI42432.1 hypothetical protein EHF33_06435 [Deinococcus psychrotolerans]
MTSSSFRKSALLTATLVLAVGPLSTSHALLDKTRFVAHLGAAYFAFHHWVWAPYRSGQFAAGAAGRTVKLVKGGAALLFAAHELNVAEKVAHNSNSPLLKKMDGELTKLQASFSNIGSDLKQGKFNEADLQSLNDQTQQVSSASAANGQTIRDIAAPIPGL